MPVQASPELNRIFETCTEETLSQRDSQLVALAAQLVLCDTVHAVQTLALARKAGATLAEILCAACHSACVSGPMAEASLVSILGDEKVGREPFSTAVEQALDEKTDHLVSLAACLAAGCDCAAGHIVAARAAGASEAELARAACIATCVAGDINKWRFGAALQCAEGQEACVC